MTRRKHDGRPFLALAALLGLAACAQAGGEEPLYGLVDSRGRTVALAGRSQIGDAPSGTMVRAVVDGQEQALVVGAAAGSGPIWRPAPAPAEPVAVVAAPAGAEPLPAALPPITTSELPPPATETQAGTRRGRAARAATTTESGANPSGRRRGPPPRSVSRSVM